MSYLVFYFLSVLYAIPLRNCSRIVRNCAQFLGVYRARDCAQVKFTCVGNPKQKISVFNIFSTRILIMNVKLS